MSSWRLEIVLSTGKLKIQNTKIPKHERRGWRARPIRTANLLLLFCAASADKTTTDLSTLTLPNVDADTDLETMFLKLFFLSH
jgi:hypothetical protein